MKSFILELHNQIINGDKTISDIVRNSIQKCKNINDTNSLVTDTYSAAEQQAKILENDIKNNQNNLLYGIPYILKDNVCTKGIKTTGGSAFLSNFIPPYSATIYDLFNQDNAVLIGKSNMDEFGMGGAGIYSAYGITKNILDPTRITGGSSSGSVNLVAAGVVPFAIGTDTGDSSRRPASLVGIVGFKPTYGLISRYGIMPYAPSMDHVGILTKTVSDVAIVADYLFKYDEKDFTSQRLPANNLFNNLTTVDKLTIGVIKDVEKYLKPDILKAYIECIELLKKNNYIVKYLDFNDQLLASVHAVYYAISYSEANSCWANLTGIPFGANFGGDNFDNIITLSRSKSLGEQVKRRFTIGAYITKKENYEKLFIHSQKIRHFLVNEWNKLLEQVDTILCPGASSTAPKIEDVTNQSFSTTFADDFLCVANFAGSPSITIPYKKVKQLPWGINLNCKAFADKQLLDFAYSIETIFEKSGVYDE